MRLTVTQIHRRTFEDKLRARTNHAIMPYDLRCTYANWLEAASITPTRRRLYMGHGAGDVTGLHALHAVTTFLEGDAYELRAFIGLDNAPSMRLMHANAY